MNNAFTITGAFCFYAAWNLFAFVAVYFFLPETKGRHLEQLDAIFDIGTLDLGRYYLSRLPVVGAKYVDDVRVTEVKLVVEGAASNEKMEDEEMAGVSHGHAEERSERASCGYEGVLKERPDRIWKF